MPKINKPKKTVKAVKKTKKLKKPVSRVLVKTKSPKAKNTLAYYQCLCHQTQQGLKGKKLTGACHDCKHNALTINDKRYAKTIKDVKKLAQAHANLKHII